MRSFGLGISNQNLEKVPIANNLINANFLKIDKVIHILINKERKKYNLTPLSWDDKIAAVAKEHSENLARENQTTTDPDLLCNYPMIHHEGYHFGLYQNTRLNNRNIYNFDLSGENIALIPKIKKIEYKSKKSYDCKTKELNNAFKIILEEAPEDEKIKIIKDEIKNRQNLIANNPNIEIIKKSYKTISEIENEAVTGWMNSPGHRANILKKEYDTTGIGVAEINDYFIITQVFTRKINCGYKNAQCCEETSYFYCYSPFTCQKNICQ